ncbi:MAG: hypothetical protein JWR66_3110 [Modestobacter sp.]|nr:hypothetical protein [Modestobacter sp.]
MTNDDQRAWYVESSGRAGLTVDPLTGARAGVPSKAYVADTDWSGGLAGSPSRPQPNAWPWTRAGAPGSGRRGTTPCTTAPSDSSPVPRVVSRPPRLSMEMGRQARGAGRSGGAFRMPKTSRSATRAALSPQCPCTAGPGGVAAEAR